MMETFYFKSIKEIIKEKENIERKLGIKIRITGKKVSINEEPYKEYEASIILEAISFGFSAKKSLSLLEEEMIFRKINIKDFTRRKNLHEVRARIIGREGKTKRTIENISGCDIILKDNTLGIIGSAESVELATMALKNLIKGSKQANVYRFLERTNKTKNIDELGLKDKEQEKKQVTKQ